jgi:hypothetical protein
MGAAAEAAVSREGTTRGGPDADVIAAAAADAIDDDKSLHAKQSPRTSAGSWRGRRTLTPPDPQLKGALVPRWFQTLHLFQVKIRFQNVPFQAATCAATPWRSSQHSSEDDAVGAVSPTAAGAGKSFSLDPFRRMLMGWDSPGKAAEEVELDDDAPASASGAGGDALSMSTPQHAAAAAADGMCESDSAPSSETTPTALMPNNHAGGSMVDLDLILSPPPTGIAMVGLYKLRSVGPQLESAWFQPLHL